MNIKRKRNKETFIRELSIGQTFIEEGEVFMFVRYEGTDIECPRCSEYIDPNQEMPYMAVSLATGEIYDFEPHAIVTIIECEVVEV
jgi:hypothetical protein